MLLGLSLVTSVVAPTRLAVVHETLEVHVDALAGIVQEVALIVPDIKDPDPLVSEQEAVEPPLEPAQFQVQAVKPFTLFVLVPEVQV